MRKRILIFIGLFLTVVVGLDIFDRPDLPFLGELERQAYDFRIVLSASEERDPQVVIVDIDEESLLKEGQWPWPRGRIADLVDSLFDHYQIDTLGFDVVFAEPEDGFTRDQVARALQDPDMDIQRLDLQSGDVRLAKAIENRKVVLGIVFEDEVFKGQFAQSVGVLPDPMFTSFVDDYSALLGETEAPQAIRYSANIEPLQQAADGRAGFFSILSPDPDGVIRRVGMLNEYQGALYGSLSLQLVRAFFLDDPVPILVDDADGGYTGLEGISMLAGDILLDEQAAVYVPYSKPSAAHEYISASKILSKDYAGDIGGSIVLLGTSSAGLGDLRAVPVAPSLPGVEVHANTVSAMLADDFRVKPYWANGADLAIVVILGLLLSFALPFMSAAWSSVLLVVVGTTVIWSNWYFWTEKNFILTVAPALFLVVSIYVLNMVVGFFSESQARRVSQKMFGLYVPPEVVTEMSNDTDIYSLRSEKRHMSVMFADIRDFTTISESMEPEELSQWLNEFLTPMTSIIHKHGGAIDKYMGDAIMAFWGAPLEDKAHARNALRAGLEMIEYLDVLNKKYTKLGRPNVNIGIGINSGMMSVGNMGSEFRMAYTVVGDAVNLGSRLEGLTKTYGVSIVVSEFSADEAPDFIYDHLDHVKVKGKNEAVTIYSCTGELADA